MSPEPGSPEQWLQFARSDLAVAAGPTGGDVLLETLCFHAQQAAEKSLKAVLLSSQVEFPRTHNLRILIDLLPPAFPSLPHADRVAALTEYATSARYPGEYENVTANEHKQAIQLAQTVVEWAETMTKRDEATGG